MTKPLNVRRVPPSHPLQRPYWEDEQPIEAWTGRICMAYHPDAGKLQIAIRFFDRTANKFRPGRAIVLDYDDFHTSRDALALLARVVREWQA